MSLSWLADISEQNPGISEREDVLLPACLLECCRVIQAPGCTLPGSGMLIEEAKVRGVKSAGMLCSAHDLGWISEEDHVLTELPVSARLGQPLPTEPLEVRQSPLNLCPSILLSDQPAFTLKCG